MNSTLSTADAIVRKRLAIVATHPVQYNAPWFRLLEASALECKVFYTWHGGERKVVDPGFQREIQWDVPLTEGYEFAVCPPSQAAAQLGFWSIDSPALLSEIDDYDPHAVLVIGWNFRSHLRALRHYAGNKLILFRGDSTLLTVKSGVRARVRSLVLRRVYSTVDKALAVGGNNCDYFLRHGLGKSQLVLAPHAIDNTRFGDQAHDKTATDKRSELGVKDSEVAILYAGKLEPVKAPLDLLNAYRVAKLSRPDLKLLVVGSGPLEHEMRTAAEGVHGVAFLPFHNQKDMPTIYRLGDVTCLCSHLETWGLCLNESMASGRGVIASDMVGAARDLVVQGQTGWRFRAGDVAALANVLTRLPSRDKLHRIGAHCQTFIADWSFESIVAAVELAVIQP